MCNQWSSRNGLADNGGRTLANQRPAPGSRPNSTERNEQHFSLASNLAGWAGPMRGRLGGEGTRAGDSCQAQHQPDGGDLAAARRSSAYVRAGPSLSGWAWRGPRERNTAATSVSGLRSAKGEQPCSARWETDSVKYRQFVPLQEVSRTFIHSDLHTVFTRRTHTHTTTLPHSTHHIPSTPCLRRFPPPSSLHLLPLQWHWRQWWRW